LKEIKDKNEQLQIQAMITLLAEKFIADKERMKKLKEALSMFAVLEMMKEDAREEARKEVKEEVKKEVKKEAFQERDIDHAKNALKEGLPLDVIRRITGLNTTEIKDLQAALSQKE
jgi:hypothetical protein